MVRAWCVGRIGGLQMSERPKADVIEKVRKLLAKTEAMGASQAEAESAFKLASRIMAEHNIEMAEIEARDGPAELDWLEDAVGDTGKWTLEQQLAYAIVKDFFFIEGFFNGIVKDGKRRKLLMFFGRADNVQVATFTYQALLNAFNDLFYIYRTKTGCPASERRLFTTGVAQGFRSRLEDERRAVEIERDILSGKQGGTAIVLASVKDQTLQKYKEAHPETSTRKHRSSFTQARGSQGALDAGIAAGRNLNLNRSIGGDAGGRKAIEGR
jgi:hypothetical protein